MQSAIFHHARYLIPFAEEFRSGGFRPSPRDIAAVGDYFQARLENGDATDPDLVVRELENIVDLGDPTMKKIVDITRSKY